MQVREQFDRTLYAGDIGSYNDNSCASRKKNDNAIAESRNLKTYIATLWLDYLVIIVPVMSFGTVLADANYEGSIFITLCTLVYITAKRYKYGGSSVSFEGDSNSIRAYISSYRFIMMIITCACILGVNFRVFPRRLAKTETYGTGLIKHFKEF